MEIAKGIVLAENTDKELILEIQGHISAKKLTKKFTYVAEVVGVTDKKIERRFFKSLWFRQWEFENGATTWYNQEGDHGFCLEFGKIYEIQPRIENIYKGCRDEVHRIHVRFELDENGNPKPELLKLSAIFKILKEREKQITNQPKPEPAMEPQINPATPAPTPVPEPELRSLRSLFRKLKEEKS